MPPTPSKEDQILNLLHEIIKMLQEIQSALLRP